VVGGGDAPDVGAGQQQDPGGAAQDLVAGRVEVPGQVDDGQVVAPRGRAQHRRDLLGSQSEIRPGRAVHGENVHPVAVRELAGHVAQVAARRLEPAPAPPRHALRAQQDVDATPARVGVEQQRAQAVAGPREGQRGRQGRRADAAGPADEGHDGAQPGLRGQHGQRGGEVGRARRQRGDGRPEPGGPGVGLGTVVVAPHDVDLRAGREREGAHLAGPVPTDEHRGGRAPRPAQLVVPRRLVGGEPDGRHDGEQVPREHGVGGQDEDDGTGISRDRRGQR